VGVKKKNEKFFSFPVFLKSCFCLPLQVLLLLLLFFILVVVFTYAAVVVGRKWLVGRGALCISQMCAAFSIVFFTLVKIKT